MTAAATHTAIDAVWRIEAPRVIAGLARLVRDVGLAEELAQDALVAALEQWPSEGVPSNPGAWLSAVGRRRAIDLIRREQNLSSKVELIGRDLETSADRSQDELEAVVEESIEDDLLRLIFTACHPALSTDARVALTLRLLGGLTTEEIARAFLQPEATVAQRIVRAKKTLAKPEIAYEEPSPEERGERLASVLEVLYLVFNEGYSATAGEDLIRQDLTGEAMRLGRMVVGLAPDEPEAHGLVALMEIQASRSAARVGPNGEPVMLLAQNRGKWDQLLIRRGLAALAVAESLCEAERSPLGPYARQAAIAACHARARTAEETDWARIASLYAELQALTPSPVVELNRAMAVAMAEGPAAGLSIIDGLVAGGELEGYHLLPGARGDLLARLGRDEEARAEFLRAAELTRNERERELMLARAGA